MATRKPRTPSFDAVLTAVGDQKYTKEQLWELQVASAEALLEDQIGISWEISIPLIPGLTFDEDTLLGIEVHEVYQRVGITLPQLRYDMLIVHGALIYELCRARLIHSMGRTHQDAEKLMKKLTIQTLVASVRPKPQSPTPKSEAAAT